MNSEIQKEFEEKIIFRDYPYSIGVEITAYCNLRCKICPNFTLQRPKGFMDLDLFKKIADETADKFPKSKFWMNGLGEPLLHRDFISMVRYATDVGINNTYINTNAMFLDEKMIDSLIQSGIHGIVVSVDGFSKEAYESIRIGGDRDLVYRNVMNALKRINAIEGDKPVLEIQFIEMPDIMHEKEMWYEFWKDKGANIKFQTYSTWGGKVDAVDGNKMNRRACGDSNNLFILWDGRIPYCLCGDAECEDELGNANTESLYDIWLRKGQTFSQYHKNHQFDKLPLSCQRCPDWRTVPARHVNMDETGN